MPSKGNAIVGDGASALQMKRPARAPPSDEHLLASPTAVAARARVEVGRRSGSVVEEEAGTLAPQCRRCDRAAAKEGGTSGKWGPDLAEPEHTSTDNSDGGEGGALVGKSTGATLKLPRSVWLRHRSRQSFGDPSSSTKRRRTRRYLYCISV